MASTTNNVTAVPGNLNSKSLNRAQGAAFVARFEKLRAGTRPAWGKLTSEEVVPHLIAAVKMSMGDAPALPFIGNWVTTNVLWPVMRTGWFSIPKNLSIKGKDGKPLPAIQSPGDTSTLLEVIEEFLRRREAGTMKCARHPVFGDVGPDGWAVLHSMHIQHHLKQFGL